MNEKSGHLAIFDLDYTLTRRGTWGRFVLQHVRFKPYLWLPLAIDTAITQWRYKAGKIPRVRVKQAMMRWCMVGKSRKAMLVSAEKFADAEVPAKLRPGALRAIGIHKAQGDNLMIVSAAVDILAQAIADRLAIPHVLGTNMAWDEQNRLSLKFASPNCYGVEKVRRLQAYFHENPHLKQKHTIITMYSDSYSDLEILQFCDIGVAVNPDRRLAKEAKGLGFRVVDWN